MIDKVINLLNPLLTANPLVALIGGIVLTLFLAWILQDQLREYVKKRFDLYSMDEALQSMSSVLYKGAVKEMEIKNMEDKNEAILDEVEDTMKRRIYS